ncbi:MAG: hypothetical protein K8F25_10215 [Fimbriimonadaceae bacterium]|nr:hypothetical protein [Alphaproteobacteria bacterium]
MDSINLNTDALSEICASVVPSDSPAQLLAKINQTDRAHRFRHVFTETGWYRVGGIVTSEGQRLADKLEDWIDANYDGDMIDFVARYGDAGYRVTRLDGKTHYLAASDGSGILDFVQVEIEEIQEVLDHNLIDQDKIPDTVEGIIDPMEPHELPREFVSPPHYICKKITRFSEFAEKLTSEFSGDPDFRRFLDEWERSSAGKAIPFWDCWSVKVLPILRGVGEHKYKVKLFSPFADQIHTFDMSGRGGGGHILSMLDAVDKMSGFPMAWYFLLITKKYMSHGLVTSIRQELGWKKQHYISFSENDREIFENWIENPYWL